MGTLEIEEGSAAQLLSRQVLVEFKEVREALLTATGKPMAEFSSVCFGGSEAFYFFLLCESGYILRAEEHCNLCALEKRINPLEIENMKNYVLIYSATPVVIRQKKTQAAIDALKLAGTKDPAVADCIRKSHLDGVAVFSLKTFFPTSEIVSMMSLRVTCVVSPETHKLSDEDAKTPLVEVLWELAQKVALAKKEVRERRRRSEFVATFLTKQYFYL
jgi:hypothetical protein